MQIRNGLVLIALFVAMSSVGAFSTPAQGGSINQQIARENFLKSLPNFKIAAKTVIGREKTESELSQYFNGLFAVKYQMKNVIKLAEATSYLKEYLAQASNAGLRREVVENIYWDARGRKPTNDELVGFETLIKLQKAWYAKEIQSQSEFFKQPAYTSEKNQMVNLAYRSSLCRDARPDELKATTSSLYINEVFALRELLWSPSYTALRNETIKLWWQNRFKRQPTAADIQSAVDSFEPVKAICSEMNRRWDVTDIK